MVHHKSDEELIRNTRNAARYFTENRHVAWVLLFIVLAWGAYGYTNMPKRKDPVIPVRVATAVTPWPGVPAERVEQLVTRAVESAIAENASVHQPSPTTYGIRGTSLTGISIVSVQLAETVNDTQREFNDINLRLNAINDQLPEGAGPIRFNSGFGDTAAIMLTVASPLESDVEVELRSRSVVRALEEVRSQFRPEEGERRAAVVVVLPRSIDVEGLRGDVERLVHDIAAAGVGRDVRPLVRPGFVGVDATVGEGGGERLLSFIEEHSLHLLGFEAFHAEAWEPVVIEDLSEVHEQLAAVRGDKYTYRDLDDFTDAISRAVQLSPSVAKAQRSGVLSEWITLGYSQEVLAAYGVKPSNLQSALSARNIVSSAGIMDLGATELNVDPSGEFTDPREIGDLLISTGQNGLPAYLRDLVDVRRGYQNPPSYLNYFTKKDDEGNWQRTRAVTVAIMMREGDQIDQFGSAMEEVLEQVRDRLPEDLIVVRTSDQPRQVEENVELFMEALYEALLLVALVALVGFREWRSSLLMMTSIPLTLAMTFGAIYLLGVQIQQVSIASLIIALGLLVDDPVVAGDAIKRELAAGHPRSIAAWLGPTKLARAILYSTITNVVAYLPFLMLVGNQGDFLHSLPIVIASTLVASRLVSMSFVPLLGYYLIRPTTKPEPSIEERRRRGFTGWYYRLGVFSIKHRKKVLLVSLAFLSLGVFFRSQLKNTYFPSDVQYLSYVDVWLPNQSPVMTTEGVAKEVEQVIRDVAAEYEEEIGRDSLQMVTTFVGGGGPRFWFSMNPELRVRNYAQLILQVADKYDTVALVPRWQAAVSERVPGAYVDVKQLQTAPVHYPVALRLSSRADYTMDGEQRDLATLRSLAAELTEILRSTPGATRVRDDWGTEGFRFDVDIDSDRANLASITNRDVQTSVAAALSGSKVGEYRERDRLIPIVARMRPAERATAADLEELYVYSSSTDEKVSLGSVATVKPVMQTERINRMERFRTITCFAFPDEGYLPSDIFGAIEEPLAEFESRLPPGYFLEVSGEHASQQQGFSQLKILMLISLAGIFIALTFQFSNAIKPIVVLTAVPYGLVGALAALYVMGSSFGFMAFLGMASLIGVIVSHVIVLFDFVEVMHERGESLEDSLLDAGIVRLRPVMITVGATVFALFPLAIHGGPLWQALCYAQIGGLAVATYVTKLQVPVIYSIFVRDLKLIHWKGDAKS
ncbi:MAG: efflux RND transporter permease subunit [Planctomycetota bacterium]|nr:efflux RND transporter permease subunit [Planctomycetota bacterium]